MLSEKQTCEPTRKQDYLGRFFDFKKNVTSKTMGTEIFVPESTKVQRTLNWNMEEYYQKLNPADQSKSERQKEKLLLKPFHSNQCKTEQQQTCYVQAESRNTFCIKPSLYTPTSLPNKSEDVTITICTPPHRKLSLQLIHYRVC